MFFYVQNVVPFASNFIGICSQYPMKTASLGESDNGFDRLGDKPYLNEG